MHFSIGEISQTTAEKKSGKNPPCFFGVLDVSPLGMMTLYEDNFAMNGRGGGSGGMESRESPYKSYTESKTNILIANVFSKTTCILTLHS